MFDVKRHDAPDTSGTQTPHLGGRYLSYAATMRVVFLLLLSLAQPVWAADGDIQRFDDRNMRVFVVISPSLVEDDAALIRVMEGVAAGIAKQRPAWEADWSVSLFAAAHLVGYKDEAHVAKYVASGEWADGYLGEYSHETRSIVLHPVNPELRREHVLQ